MRTVGDTRALPQPIEIQTEERPGAGIVAAADLLRRIDYLINDIEAFKAERAAEAVRVARARLGTAYHAKRLDGPDAEAA